MARKKRYSVYAINVKLQSNERSGNQAYEDIFSELWTRRIAIKIDEDHAIYLRTQFVTNIDNTIVIYGIMTRFISFQQGDWFNVPEGETVDYNSPENLGAKPKDTNYYFIPAAHRFIFLPDNGFSTSMVTKFLEQALKKVIKQTEQIDVIVQQSQSTFEEIFNAYKLEELKVHLSYSNNDGFSIDLERQMDDEIRNAQITDLTVSAKSEVEENILLTEMPMINTALKLAQSGQGTAEAKIKYENGKTRRIKTSEHPEKIELDEETDENNLTLKIVRKIMSIFRRND